MRPVHTMMYLCPVQQMNSGEMRYKRIGMVGTISLVQRLADAEALKDLSQVVVGKPVRWLRFSSAVY